MEAAADAPCARQGACGRAPAIATPAARLLYASFAGTLWTPSSPRSPRGLARPSRPPAPRQRASAIPPLPHGHANKCFDRKTAPLGSQTLFVRRTRRLGLEHRLVRWERKTKFPNRKGGNLAAWPMVAMPKDRGGLGIKNLRIQNNALLLKHLHNFYCKKEVPWVKFIWTRYYQNKVPHAAREMGSFWWKDILRLYAQYKEIAKCQIGMGDTVLFWGDQWSEQIMASKYPQLFPFAKNRNISVKAVMENEELNNLFHLPLTAQAYQELQHLQVELETMEYNSQAKDIWVFAIFPLESTK
ncbi:hypothetical protein EJB05_48023, partial [Eragrostis curvula]